VWLELSDGEIEAIHDALIDQEVELAQDDDSGQTKLAWVTDLAGLRWHAARARPGVV
jgi:hypothetical protein